MAVDSRVEELLLERPELEDSLEDILAVDDTDETWTFDDIPIDSGTFGQLVSEGIVETVDDQYRLANPDEVRRALGMETEDDTADTASLTTPSLEKLTRSVYSIDRYAVLMLSGVLVVMIAIRSYIVGSIFRPNAVVLAGNDPYFYRYWVEKSFAEGMVGFIPLAEVPDGIESGEPLLVATLAWISGLFGGVDASGAVLALYPVATALLVGVGLYSLAMVTTADRRVALSAVLMLAITPANALRTALGFADHHAFDFVWLILTALALAVFVSSERDGWIPTLSGTLGVGVGVAGQVLAWDNGALLVVPLGAVIGGLVFLAVHNGRSPLRETTPILLGVGFATLGIYGAHTIVGWHTQTVVLTPALVLGGGFAVAVIGEAAFRADLSFRASVALELVVVAGSLAVIAVLFPDYWRLALGGIDRLTGRQDIAEVQPLFSGNTLGFLFLFGFILFVAVPVLVWASVRLVNGATRWLVPTIYGWYFLGLAMFQVRFAGELAPFTALFAGVGFVWLAEKVDLTQPLSSNREFAEWVPGSIDRSTLLFVLVLFVLVGGLSVGQSVLKVSQITTDDVEYETAAQISAYADDHGWESYEESYVLSMWGKNRMYNYFVNGQSQSYGYAQSAYGNFLAQTDPEEAASQLSERVRFVVTMDALRADRRTMQMRLHRHFGSRNSDIPGTGQFRAVYVTEQGNRKAFVRVPGAKLSGSAETNTTVSLATNVSVSGTSFMYEREVTATPRTGYTVRVAYPGTYEITVNNQSKAVTVSEHAVLNGTTVSVP